MSNKQFVLREGKKQEARGEKLEKALRNEIF